MKIKKLLISTAFVASVVGLAACGNPGSSQPGPSSEPSSGPVEKKGKIQVAVGKESAEFYTTILNEYVESHPSFAYNVEVVSSDAGTVADAVIKDGEAAPDIFTVAHDNIGKLTEAQAVLPYVGEEVKAQLEADNPDAFKGVIKVEGEYYAAPYISQALVLLYNKDKVSADQAKSFEGLKEAAKAANAKAITVSGTDGFNFSAFPLARKVSDRTTTVKMYEGGDQSNCYFQGEDTFQITKWAQAYFADANGGMFPTDAGWAAEVKAGKCLSLIGGAWHFSDFAQALGSESKMGITILPTLTAGGVEYRAGSFVDCKVLMLNAYTVTGDKYAAAQEIVQYMTSKDVQNKSFKECSNMPAYKGADAYIESIKDTLTNAQYEGAVAQSKMGDWGIAQPFVNSVLNQYYYSKGAADIYKNVVLNAEDKDKNHPYGTDAGIRKALYEIEYIWQKGAQPAPADIPAKLPSDVK